MSTLIVTVLRLLQLGILARFLSPQDFGLMAIVMVIVGFLDAFVDAGLSNAIIHHREPSHVQLSSLYWLNIAAGTMMLILVASVSPLVAHIFDEPRLTNLLLALSVMFLITAIGNQYRVLFQKTLQFDRIAKIEIAASLVAVSLAVTLAVQGYGVYALVSAVLAQVTISSLSFFAIGVRLHHRPAFLYKHSDLDDYLNFGMFQMGERSINYVSANIDKILIGKILGMQAVGFYNLAWQLVLFPLSKINPIVGRVALPVYAKLQDDREVLNRYYRFSLAALCIATAPIITFLFFFSSDIVLIVVGPGWEQTSVLISILAIVGMLKALGNPGGAVVLALGRADIGFWWNLLWATAVAIALTSAIILFSTVEAVAFTLLGLSCSLGVVWHWIVARAAKIEYLPIILHCGRIIVFSFLAGSLTLRAIDALQPSTPLGRVALASIVYLSVYMAYLASFERGMVNRLSVESK